MTGQNEAMRLDVDSDDEVGDLEYSLGFVEPPRRRSDLFRHRFPSKVGGAPAWLDPVHLPSSDVLVFRGKGVEESTSLRFLLQVRAERGQRGAIRPDRARAPPPRECRDAAGKGGKGEEGEQNGRAVTSRRARALEARPFCLCDLSTCHAPTLPPVFPVIHFAPSFLRSTPLETTLVRMPSTARCTCSCTRTVAA